MCIISTAQQANPNVKGHKEFYIKISGIKTIRPSEQLTWKFTKKSKIVPNQTYKFYLPSVPSSLSHPSELEHTHQYCLPFGEASTVSSFPELKNEMKPLNCLALISLHFNVPVLSN